MKKQCLKPPSKLATSTGGCRISAINSRLENAPLEPFQRQGRHAGDTMTITGKVATFTVKVLESRYGPWGEIGAPTSRHVGKPQWNWYLQGDNKWRWNLAPINGQTKNVFGGYNGKKNHSSFTICNWLGPTLHLQSDDVWWFRWFGSTTPKIDGNMMSYDSQKRLHGYIRVCYQCPSSWGGFGNITMVGPSKKWWVTSPHKTHDSSSQGGKTSMHVISVVQPPWNSCWSCGFFHVEPKNPEPVHSH